MRSLGGTRQVSGTTAASRSNHGRDSKPSSCAASAGGRASSSTLGKTATASGRLKRSALTDAGRIYVEAVLDRYLWLPGTPTRASRQDRGLARGLHERGVPLAVVQAALLLGAARRTFRPPDALPLPPIRTFNYFLRIIEEIQEFPPAPDYLLYLEGKLQPWADAKADEAWDPRL